VIIPYKEDRGWLQDAIESVPSNVQLLLGKGNGNWPANFNKMLPEAKGKYIRYLHEDDMLSANCIEDSLRTFQETDADFIHGNAEEFYSFKPDRHIYVPKIKDPTLQDMLQKNYIHSATLMYKCEVFEKLGGFDEKLNIAEEYEFSLRCLKAGMKLAYCPSVLAHYRRHPMQKVRMVPRNEKTIEREMVRKRYRA
jgi:GT2 family glycosyltransferase